MLNYLKGYWLGFLDMDRIEKAITIGMILLTALFAITT